MDVITIVESLLRRWWLVLLMCAAGLACAYYLAINAPRRYQSTVSLQLNPAATSSFLPYQSDASVGSSNPVAVQAASYQEVLRSRTFDQVVVQQLNLQLPPEAIGGAISTQLVPNTNILHLSVTWDNPSDAEQLAQHVAEIFIAENQRRQQSQPGVQAQLADMEQSARDMQARRGPLQQQRDRLEEAVARGDLSRLSDLSALETRLSDLDTSYANLLVQMSRLRGSFDTAVILDTATPAHSTDSVPLTQALVFGVLAGAAAGAVLSFLLEKFADKVRAPSDAVAASGLPLVGRIKHMRGGKRLVALAAPQSATTEAFRSLRTAILLSSGVPPQCIVVTGAERHDGATFVAANLAIVLAQAGRRVLLVDGNLRKPALHALFNISNTTGFADLLRLSRNGAQDGAQPSDVPQLSIMPAGAPMPDVGEVLTPDRVARAFEHLQGKWDTVIIDGADLSRTADTLVLAHEASACIVVARSSKTTRGALASAVAALDGASVQLLGVVLNDEHPRPLGRFVRSPQYRPGFEVTSPALEPGQVRLPRSNGHPTSDSWRD
ncbi:MAG: polysaccharide biosynthesis tyrosine autokinase [Chloroflexi bacterium]|nr:polysaccharide biosynthesis tyrosine autokinase [Chloroflexota bacterium]